MKELLELIEAAVVVELVDMKERHDDSCSGIGGLAFNSESDVRDLGTGTAF